MSHEKSWKSKKLSYNKQEKKVEKATDKSETQLIPVKKKVPILCVIMRENTKLIDCFENTLRTTA